MHNLREIFEPPFIKGNLIEMDFIIVLECFKIKSKMRSNNGRLFNEWATEIGPVFLLRNKNAHNKCAMSPISQRMTTDKSDPWKEAPT